ncbi:MAG TPA: hypothetical protein VII56_02225 [Rhizomicrobium sp.]
MSWFDNIQANLHDIAAKAGMTPDKLKAVTDTLNHELSRLPDHARALKATAEQHGIEVGKIQDALEHAGTELGKQADSIADQVFKKKP